MIGKTYSACIQGVNGIKVEVEADVTGGIPGFELTGNLSGIVKESRERVRLALRNSGIKLNPSRIVINLAPAKLRKEGAHYDLAIAVSVLCATGILELEISDTLFIGELALDGRVQGVKGVLPMIDMAQRLGFRRCIVPDINAGEGTLIQGIDVIGVNSLKDCIDYFRGDRVIQPINNSPQLYEADEYEYDYSDIHGQTGLKRGMLIAAAGRHNILMVGPPGAGKTMAAMRINTIMPPLTQEQVIDVSRVYSVAGLLGENNCYVQKRPFRAPNYTITSSAMAGGGYNPIPGEMSLAEQGVLFLDELNLFKPEVVETLRIPLESKRVRVNRVNGTYEYPADFMLVAAINPCKCGYYPDRGRCNCTPWDIKQHMGRVSRPILDRIDMCVEAPKVQYEEMEQNVISDIYSSENMRNRVLNIQEIQQDRYSKHSFKYNSQIPINRIQYFCPMENDAKALIKNVYDKYDLTARSYHKIIKVARTIADMEGHERIMLQDIGEAVGYKMLEVEA